MVEEHLPNHWCWVEIREGLILALTVRERRQARRSSSAAGDVEQHHGARVPPPTEWLLRRLP
jgi:hypothetical protein